MRARALLSQPCRADEGADPTVVAALDDEDDGVEAEVAVSSVDFAPGAAELVAHLCVLAGREQLGTGAVTSRLEKRFLIYEHAPMLVAEDRLHPCRTQEGTHCAHCRNLRGPSLSEDCICDP